MIEAKRLSGKLNMDESFYNLPQEDYAYALTMMSIGQAREKFAQIAGPQGGGTLNGTAMKGEAQTQMDSLIESLKYKNSKV